MWRLRNFWFFLALSLIASACANEELDVAGSNAFNDRTPVPTAGLAPDRDALRAVDDAARKHFGSRMAPTLFDQAQNALTVPVEDLQDGEAEQFLGSLHQADTSTFDVVIASAWLGQAGFADLQKHVHSTPAGGALVGSRRGPMATIGGRLWWKLGVDLPTCEEGTNQVVLDAVAASVVEYMEPRGMPLAIDDVLVAECGVRNELLPDEETP